MTIGVEREMQVCHTQPHLVPPMKLVVYDDLPSPGAHHQHRNSLSSWISEGRNLASRASTRASISWKRHSTTPLRISAPSDFRRVQSFQPPPPLPTKYQPLELSIYRSGNRLSDLPSFDSFQLDEEGRQRQTLAVPPRALSPTRIHTRRCQSNERPLVVSRKPVGSGNRRSFRNSKRLIEPPQPVRIASALIPHFSIVGPVETLLPEPESMPAPVHVRSVSGESRLTLNTEWPSHVNNNARSPVEPEPQTPLSPKIRQEEPNEKPLTNEVPQPRNSPSTASSRTMPSRISSLRRPSTAENRKTIASVPLPNRMTQWFFPSKVSSPKQVSLAGENGFAWERTRTLSGTTVDSTTTTINGGAETRKPNISISSIFTSGTTPRTSLRGPSPSADKELEAGFCHPTIHAGRPQQHSFSSSHRDDHAQYGDSTAGLVF